MVHLKRTSDNAVFPYSETLVKKFPEFVQITQEERDSLIKDTVQKKAKMLAPAPPPPVENKKPKVVAPTEFPEYPKIPVHPTPIEPSVVFEPAPEPEPVAEEPEDEPVGETYETIFDDDDDDNVPVKRKPGRPAKVK